ncbi:MAG: glycosyltransferase [Chloroflexi bacterium]|nr:glycosyltransferase [Chloroflexota bacterium]
MSRVLFLTPQLPYPPHQGAAIRNLNLIKIASQRHEVAVYSFVRSAAEAAVADVLREWACDVKTFAAPRRRLPQRAVQTIASPLPDMARRLHSLDLAQAVAAVEADVVQAEGIEMVQYLDWTSAHKVFDCHNAEWILQRRTCEVDLRRGRPIGAAYSLVQWLKLRAYERAACQRADAVIAVSKEDRAALLDLDPGLCIEVIPNGVDAAFFKPLEHPKEDAFLFTGVLDFRPNVDAVRWLTSEIWPLIRQQLPNAQLTLAGRAPIADIRRLDGVDGIRVVASPPDIRPFFAESAVYLVPVRAGGGSRYKLLQALSMSLGVVSTTLGAEGIAARDGEHLRLADSPADVAAAAVELARDEAQRGRLGAAGRELVLASYDWPVLAPKLHEVYSRQPGRRPPFEPAPVSVVLTVLNEAGGVGNLLQDLQAQDQPADEIIVVDGGSTDGTPELIRRQDGVQLIEAPGANISQGRNRGIAAARNVLLAVTDAGVRLGPDWLRLITAPLQAGRADVVAGFFQRDPHSPFEEAMGATVLPSLADVDPSTFLPSSRSIAFRKGVWEQAGRYPDWLDYCEDLIFDFTARSLPDVRITFEPRAVARFRPRSSLPAFFHQYYRYARGDGKAGLWGKRHAVRYGAYVLLALALISRRKALAPLLLAGVALYLRKPFQRLRTRTAYSLALLPLIRLTGDLAKMLGYPAGLRWRAKHRPPDWRKAPA